MRKVVFSVGECYHIYNRGVDKRNILKDRSDWERFFKSMREFNRVDTVGSLYELSFVKSSALKPEEEKLVDFIAYCINPNHYHFILRQVSEKGIAKFMQRLGTGYTKYFNERHKRTGVLFQGKFKAVHVDTNSYLLHLSAYVNLNDRVHQLGSRTSKLMSRTSYNEYLSTRADHLQQEFCDKGIVLGQFKDVASYQIFAESSVAETIRRRIQDAEHFDMGPYLLE